MTNMSITIISTVILANILLSSSLKYSFSRSENSSLVLRATLNYMFFNTSSCVMLVASKKDVSVIMANIYQKSNKLDTFSLIIHHNDKIENKITRRSFSDSLKCALPNRYVLVPEKIDTEYFKRFLTNVPTADHDGMILVLTKQVPGNAEFLEMFRVFHDYYAHNVLIATSTGAFDKIVRQKHGSLVYYNTTKRTTEIDIIKHITKRRRYFRAGSIFRVVVKSYQPTAFMSVYPQPKVYNGSLNGVEGIILDKALRATGASPMYLVPTTDMDIGYREDNGTFTGALADILAELGELAGNPRLLTYEWMDKLSFTYPHNRDNYCIVVKKAQQAPRYLTLILVFSENVWLAVCFTVLFLALTKFFMTTVQSKRRVFSALGEALFATYHLIMTGSYYTESSKNSNRIFLTKSLLYSILILNTYQGALYSFLTSPVLLPDIHTLQEVNDKLHTVYIFQPYVNMFDSLDEEDIMKIMSNRMIPVLKDLIKASNEVANNYGYGFLLNSAVNHMLQRLKMKDGKSKLYVVDECALSPGYIGFPVRRHWPGLPRLNSIIQHLLQGGFLVKWLQDVDYEFTLKGNYGDPNTINSPQKLGLEHFQGAFLVLAFGLGISFMAFGLESNLLRCKKNAYRIINRFPRVSSWF